MPIVNAQENGVIDARFGTPCNCIPKVTFGHLKTREKCFLLRVFTIYALSGLDYNTHCMYMCCCWFYLKFQPENENLMVYGTIHAEEPKIHTRVTWLKCHFPRIFNVVRELKLQYKNPTL